MLKCGGLRRRLCVSPVQWVGGALPTQRAFLSSSTSSAACSEKQTPPENTALSLQAIFGSNQQPMTCESLQQALHAYDPSLRRALVEVTDCTEKEMRGTARWFAKPYNRHNKSATPCTLDDLNDLAGTLYHSVQFNIRNEPLSPGIVAACVETAMYDETIKTEARASRASALLLHSSAVEESEVEGGCGAEQRTSHLCTPLDQYVALSAVAAALVAHGAVCLVNGNAQSSAPASLVSREALLESVGEDVQSAAASPLAALAEAPLLSFFCGFKVYGVRGEEGVWMLTTGAEFFGIPNIAYRAPNVQIVESVFYALASLTGHMLKTGECLKPGEKVQLGEDVGAVQFRMRRTDDQGIPNDPSLLIMETLRA